MPAERALWRSSAARRATTLSQYALTALERLTHRGGVDADGASGDGAGLLTSIPEAFFRARAAEQGIELTEHFGLGFAFFPAGASTEARAAVEAAADTERLRILGWRRVPVATASLGRMALETMPETWQFFVAPFHATRGPSRFEWRLALLQETRGVVAAAALLHLFAVVADGRLQRAADAVAVSAILRRFARSFVCDDVRGFSPALFDEHVAFVASGAAVPVFGAQRRDQYDHFQPALDSREGSRTAREADRGHVVPDSGRKRQRFGEL